MMHFTRTAWRFAASTAVLALAAAPAAAQDADEDRLAPALVDEIVVTARRTEENLQDVPVSVTAFSTEDIIERGFQNIEDLSRQTPGFVFDTPFGRQFDRPIIRGQANILGASGVSVFIDGVNVPQSIRSLNFGDIEQIEIIKGPQSALFGRNTYSGAINITTRQPTNDLSADFSLNLGQYGYKELLATASMPIIEDRLFASLSGRLYSFNSEFDNDNSKLNPSLGNESSKTLGLKLTAMLNDNWESRLRVNYNSDDDGHFPIGLLGFDDLNVNVPGGRDLGGTQPFFDGVVRSTGTNPSGSNQLSDTLGEGGGIEREEFFISLSNEFGLGNGYTLFNTLGYTREEFRDELDSDGQPEAFTTARIFGPFPLGPGAPFGVGLLPFDFTTTDDDTQDTFVAELRLDSPVDEAFRWRLGGYYFENDRKDRDLLERFENGRFEQAALDSFNQSLREIAAALGQFFVVPLTEFSYGPTVPRDTQIENTAIYGSVAYDVNDQLSVSAEARYQEERISQQEGTFTPETKFTAFTPRFTVDYELNDDTLLYGVAARGTKPGGFNGADADAVGFGTFDEETAWSFELGAKNSFAGGRGLFNAAGFFTDLSGYQLTENLRSLGAGSANTTASATANVGEVEIFGIELETAYSFEAGPGFGTVGGSYAYTDATFTEGTELTQGLVFGDNSLEGQRLPRQAPHQAAGYVEYVFDTGVGSLSANLNGSYLSSRFAQVQNLAETGDSFELDARLTLDIDDTYSVSVYGKNLTDEDAVLSVLRFIDPIGTNSFTVAGQPIPSTFNLASAGQSRGFQYNNRHGRRFGVVLRAKW